MPGAVKRMYIHWNKLQTNLLLTKCQSTSRRFVKMKINLNIPWNIKLFLPKCKTKLKG